MDTAFLRRCIVALEHANVGLVDLEKDDEVMYDIYRAACVKEFELILEHVGSLLRNCLVAYYASKRHMDRFYVRDIFRLAAKHVLLPSDKVERWLGYRDHRNYTVHFYREDFAEDTLVLLSGFIADARALTEVIEQADDS